MTADISIVQLKAMIKAGASLEEACEVLELDVDAAMMYLNNENEKEISCEEIIRQKKPRMLQILAEIAEDVTIENVSARVAAARVFVEGKGELPELPVDKLSELFAKMKGAVSKQEAEMSKGKNSVVTTNQTTTTLSLVNN